MGALAQDVRGLFEAPNFLHVATVLTDGSPHSVAVWTGVVDDRPCFFTQPSSQKARNLARDRRLAASIVARDNPYRTAWLRGHVARTLEGADALTVIDELSEKYTGKPFPMRSGVVFVIEVDSQNLLDLPFADAPSA
jgi:PPOX class probable F420-dependent enzyme